MAVKRNLFVIAFVITAFLFVTLLFLNRMLDDKRERFIEENMQEVHNSVNEMQTLLLMGDTFGERMTCLVFSERLHELDKSIWTLGLKIDQYRQASEEFLEDPWYKEQKRVFNEQEVLYLNLLKTSKQKCGFETPVIQFFYQNSADCRKCDDQSFVLADINRKYGEDISIFNFDTDLGLTTVHLLTEYYEVDEYPCLVIEDQKYCGIQGREEIIQHLCETTNASLCSTI